MKVSNWIPICCFLTTFNVKNTIPWTQTTTNINPFAKKSRIHWAKSNHTCCVTKLSLSKEFSKQKEGNRNNKLEVIPSRVEDILVLRDENISTENVSTSGSNTLRELRNNTNSVLTILHRYNSFLSFFLSL